jgi:hypothetical protein
MRVILLKKKIKVNGKIPAVKISDTPFSEV